MKKFLAVISSEQFDNLYRFGKIYHPVFLSTENNKEDALIDIFNTFIQFVYDENYLVLEYSIHEIDENPYHLINIETVERVFPISIECREALILKKSTQVKFEKPIFSISNYEIINHKFYISEAMSGSEMLLKVFNYAIDLDQFNCEIKSAILKRRSGLKISKLDNKASLIDFCFLYVYEAYYPLNTIGYLIRTVEIFTRFKLAEQNNQYSPDILKKREIYQMLMELNNKQSSVNFDLLLEELSKDSRAIKFTTNLVVNNIKYYFVIPLFLKIVDEFNEFGGTLAKTNLTKIIEKYNLSYREECKTLLTLLGSYLGYGNCYDFCYPKMNLKFFNSYNEANLKVNELDTLPKNNLEDNSTNSQVALTVSNEILNTPNSNENLEENVNADLNNKLDDNAIKLLSIKEIELTQSNTESETNSNAVVVDKHKIEIVANINLENNHSFDAELKSKANEETSVNVDCNAETENLSSKNANEIDFKISKSETKFESLSQTNINKKLPLEFLSFDQFKLTKTSLNYLKSIWQDSLNANLSNDEQVILFITKIETDISSTKKPKIKSEDLEKIKSILLSQ